MISQGEVWWVDLPESEGSGPAFTRPAVVVQSDSFNQSRIQTVVAVPLTTNMSQAESPGNLALESAATGLPHASVVNVSLIFSEDRSRFRDRVGKVTPTAFELILHGIDLLLGR